MQKNHIDKPKESQTLSPQANTKKDQSQPSGFQFWDNRPEAIQMRKLQKANNNSQRNTIFQFVDNRPEAIAQRKLQKMANNSPRNQELIQLQHKANAHTAKQELPIQKKKNNTGLPDNLKAGIENLSGYSLDDVKVHYNSSKPAQLNASAYTQGTDIHVGPGQERHLPHEGWHVVQQKQRRVKPTMQMKGGIQLNDNPGLEAEATYMAEQALQRTSNSESGSDNKSMDADSSSVQLKSISHSASGIIQRAMDQDQLKILKETLDGLKQTGALDEETFTKILNHFSTHYDTFKKAFPHLQRKLQQQQERSTSNSQVQHTNTPNIEPKAPPPEPELRGMIWNLHGFSNVVTKKKKSEDSTIFHLIGGRDYDDRQSYVEAIMDKIKGRTQKDARKPIKNFEKKIHNQVAGKDENELENLLNLPLSEKQKKQVYRLAREQDKNIPQDYAKKLKDTEKYQVKPDQKKRVIKALKANQAQYDKTSKKYQEIDILLNKLQATEVLRRFQEPRYVSKLFESLNKKSIPKPNEDTSLIELIDHVKELRALIKTLSIFETQTDEKNNQLHQFLNDLGKTLNALINRNKTEEYKKDNQNLVVYLDQELNKYAIVSYINSLLNDEQLNLDFMLLNEMNQGINSFTKEVQDATKNKYQVESGPKMAAMNKIDEPSQREYYPLVYNAERFEYIDSFYVGVINEKTEKEDKNEILWMKPEKKKENDAPSEKTEKTEKEDTEKEDKGAKNKKYWDDKKYLDYRPIVVHRLKEKEDRLKEKKVSKEKKSPQKELWLAAVHTTPYDSEFDRKKIYKQLEAPLKKLKERAIQEGATLIIGGDFYIAAEALVKSPEDKQMKCLSTPEEREKGEKTKIRDLETKFQNVRNLRDDQGDVYNFEKALRGDIDPIGDNQRTQSGMGLSDVRALTGTNKNSQGLQSADYFIVPCQDEDRVFVGLIDPRTRKIVELEAEDQSISKHNMHFSDHLISAIDVYDTEDEKDQARLFSRYNNESIDDSYLSYVEKIVDLDTAVLSSEWDDENAPPPLLAYGRLDIQSLITTYLFQIWNTLETLEETTKDTSQKTQYQKFAKKIGAIHEQIKKGEHLIPLTNQQQQQLLKLLKEIKLLSDSKIKEYSKIIIDLISNYLKPTDSTFPSPGSQKRGRDGDDDAQKGPSSKRFKPANSSASTSTNRGAYPESTSRSSGSHKRRRDGAGAPHKASSPKKTIRESDSKYSQREGEAGLLKKFTIPKLSRGVASVPKSTKISDKISDKMYNNATRNCLLLDPDNSHVLEVYETSADGNCGLHAMYGMPNRTKEFTCSNVNDLRSSLSKAIAGGLVDQQRYEPMLLDLISEIYNKHKNQSDMSPDEKNLWSNFSQIKNFTNDLREADEKAERDQDELNKTRDGIVETYYETMTRQSFSSFLYRKYLITAYEGSKSKEAKVILGKLTGNKRVEGKAEELIQILKSNKEEAIKLISESLDQLRTVHVLVNKDSVSKRYDIYKRDLDLQSKKYQKIVQTYYHDLLKGYATSVEAPGYYLREEDLETLANLTNKDLIIYRENDQIPGTYVKHSQIISKSNSSQAIHVYHSGAHYERARLIPLDKFW